MTNGPSYEEIDFNERFREAWQIIENTDRNLLLTGRAGTGKSTFLRLIRYGSRKNKVVIAPTGVSALNVEGQTIHSFFGFGPDITLEKVGRLKPEDKSLYKNLQLIIIDEISMVRADLLDCVDLFLRIHGPRKNRPFGGVQMVFIGDLYQLPPVVTAREREAFQFLYETPYFFSSSAFKSAEFEFVEFEKVYRQKEADFLEILNRIRNGSADENILEELNRRLEPDFEPPPEEFYIYLTTTNARAEEINLARLEQLRGRAYKFEGMLEGKLGLEELPVPLELTLKVGAQVMLLNNDPEGRWVNGDVGRVKRVRAYEEIVEVELNRGYSVNVTPYQWKVYEYYFDGEEGQIKSRAVGSYTQFPLKLAWAITIHKSQGLTFDRVIIDLEKGTFAHGQLYTALSRCRSLDGLILKRPVKKGHIKLDRSIVRFLTAFQYRKAEEKLSREEKIRILNEAIREGEEVEIIYLKSSDEKTVRRIKPLGIEEVEFRGKPFTALRAFCYLRGKERVFNIDKILSIRFAT